MELSPAELRELLGLDPPKPEGVPSSIQTHACSGVVDIGTEMGNRLAKCAVDAERRCDELLVDLLDKALGDRGY